MGKPKIRPFTAPTFSTDLFEAQNQKRYPGYDPACKIWLMWDDEKGVCENDEFWLTFGSFFVLLASRPDHTVRPITTNEGSKHVFLRKEVPFGVSMIKKIKFRGQNFPKTWFLEAWRGILSRICEIFKSRYLEKYKLDQCKIWRASLGPQTGFVGGPALQNNNLKWRPPSWIFAQTLITQLPFDLD